MRSRPFGLLVLVQATLTTPQLAFGQQAPTGGHYAGRATDTGHAGSPVNATGVYATSIPLALPTERAGLPIPLEISYSARGVGAAGLGWDIPLSYIRRDRTFAHRRPAYSGYALPQPRERLFLSLLGTSGELTRNGDAWTLRTGTLELAVHESGSVYVGYDGAGRTYTFARPAQVGNAGLWLLKSVSAAGGATVALTYQINSRTIDGGAGLEVNLTRIAYNTSPLTSCAKHEIALTYGNSSTSPLSISMLGDKALARFNTLTTVDVMSRADCTSSPRRLRRYELKYPTPDPDTHLPRLRYVRMLGREGTPEGTEPGSLPVAAYEYGTATNNGSLKYEVTQTVRFPPDVDGNKISGTDLDPSVVSPPPAQRYAMWQSLIDVTGDGRPDLVYKKNNKLHVALNHSAPGGGTTLGYHVPLYDSTFKTGPFSTHSTTKRRLWWGTANRNTVNVWRQAIDVNGDGRLDIIDAAAEAKRWIVYLNTPGGPTGIKWKRRSLSVQNLALELTSRGHSVPGGYVPLARRTTGVSENKLACVRRDGAKWVPFTGTCHGENGTVVCLSGHPQNVPPPPPPKCIDSDACAPPTGYEPEKTYVEWEFTDLNGDGYPDFVFNSAPADFIFSPTAEGLRCGLNGEVFIGETRASFQLPSSNTLRAAYNIVGVRFRINEGNPFARSVSLQCPGAEGCIDGVGLWMGADMEGKVQEQLAGLADVNGDGLVDRVVGSRAYLGVFIGTAQAFSNAYLRLPGVLSQQQSDQKKSCEHQDRFDSALTKGLRDLTGDGIPDYFDKSGVWGSDVKVAIGTGAGFASPVPVVGVVFQPSHQRETCNGDISNVDGGLFDIDGDGKPEIIGVVKVDGHPAYLVSQLKGGPTPRTPEAGRLTSVDNGYGAVTRIAYRSAKEDLYSVHQVPFPEIVVTSVETAAGPPNPDGALAGTRYAYGNAQMIFDSARDAFVFPGYGRTVELYLYNGLRDKPEGIATLVDYWPLTPFSPGLTEEERWLRGQRVGRVRDIYSLRGSRDVDPWPLLQIAAADPRITGVRHTEWGARLLETSIRYGRVPLDVEIGDGASSGWLVGVV